MFGVSIERVGTEGMDYMLEQRLTNWELAIRTFHVLRWKQGSECATMIQPRCHCQHFQLAPCRQARVTLTRQPWGNEIVRLVLARNGPESRASRVRKVLKKLNSVYAIWVSANCWPGQIRGPPLKGMYSQLMSRGQQHASKSA